MSKLITLLLGVALLFGFQTLVLGAAMDTSSLSSVTSIPDGYKLVPAIMVGEVDGIPFNLTGTTNSVLAQLEQKHPNVDFAARAMEANRSDTSAAGISLAKKDLLPRSPAVCISQASYEMARACASDVYDAVKGMENYPGNVFVGPRSCAIVACRDSAEIILCNDNEIRIGVVSRYLAAYPRLICDDCYVTQGGVTWCWKACGGRLFDNRSFNVITRRRMTNC